MIFSLILGGIIGFERRASERPAGIRTMGMVCLGSCFFSMTSQLAFKSSTMGWDAARVVRFTLPFFCGWNANKCQKLMCVRFCLSIGRSSPKWRWVFRSRTHLERLYLIYTRGEWTACHYIITGSPWIDHGSIRLVSCCCGRCSWWRQALVYCLCVWSSLSHSCVKVRFCYWFGFVIIL
jgi:uncharacterized membrane protein (UPF0136 family)